MSSRSSNWEKSLREQKPRRHPKNPSFSTILLDEMFRSIDGDVEKYDNRKPPYREQSSGRRTTSNNNNGVRKVVEDEEVASLRRAYLMEKLMEKKINDKVKSRRTSSSLPDMESSRLLLQDNDPMFFSTSSSSSSDSSSGGLSLSDAEFYGSAKSRTSCFSSSRPKPRKANHFPVRSLRCLNPYEQSEYLLFDDYHSHHHHHQTGKAEENLIKSKSTALKIYSNLKKVKQPISPGGKLTNFINSLFTNANSKKTKSVDSKQPKSSTTTANAAAASTCSSASSFSRSCLNKNTKYDKGDTRTVRFYPVSVIVDEDSRPCGQKSVYGGAEFYKQMEKNRKITKGYHQDQKKRDYFIKEQFEDVQHYEDEDIDAASDSSSDLFEIDHLTLFGDTRFCDELPVYETTLLDRNRVIC